MDAKRIVREGFVSGLIGAGAVATWFLLVDVIAGRPFFTPSMLGSAVFWGVRDAAAVQVAFPAVVGYTMVHTVAFIVVGMLAALLAYEVEMFPTTLFLVAVSFAIFEFGFYVLVATLASQLLGALAWWNVAIGNAIAAFGMGFYLWKMHPTLRQELARHPLGESMDQGADEEEEVTG